MSAAFSRPVYRSTVDRHVGHVVMETSQAQARIVPLIKETDMWLYGRERTRNGNVYTHTHTHIAREP